MDTIETMHGLAIKKFCNVTALAELLGHEVTMTEAHLTAFLSDGTAISNKGMFMLTPKGQSTLLQAYPECFESYRSDVEFCRGYDQFEHINNNLKQLITEWQTVAVAGEIVPNDHLDKAYDEKVISQIANLHERADALFSKLARRLPRLQRYTDRLALALDKVDEGKIEYVSGAKVDSYHTVWFELHEDLLRILDRKRIE